MVFGLNLFEHCKVKPQISLRHSVLYPGNILEGVVILNVSAPVEYTAVRVKLCGKERVHITQHVTVVKGRIDERRPATTAKVAVCTSNLLPSLERSSPKAAVSFLGRQDSRCRLANGSTRLRFSCPRTSHRASRSKSRMTTQRLSTI